MTSLKSDVNELVKELDELEEINRKQQRVLSQLLDTEFSKKEQFVALKGEMGELKGAGLRYLIPSYTTVHSLNWVGTFIKMGSDMPLMQSKIEEGTGRLLVDAEIAEQVQQRAPDWTRQPALTAYLIHSQYRKFSTILAVVSPAWVDDPQHENWGKDGRALKNAINFRSLDSAGKIGLLDLSDTPVYALDGQHRVMGIRGVQDLQANKFVLKKKDGTHLKTNFDRDDFLAQFSSDLNHLQRVLNEAISVEYISAVLPGETRKEAAQRIRSVFVAINSYAKKVDKGENILLDESDGYSITGRAIAVHHPLFNSADNTSRVNFKNTSLPARTNWYTTLQALREVAEQYLTEIKPAMAKNWEAKFDGQVPMRPEENELENSRDLLFEFFNHVAKLPVFMGLESGDELSEVREFPSDTDGGKGHLLLRPIGLPILAKAVGWIVKNKGLSLDEIFAKLEKFDKRNGFEQYRPENIWYGVTYNSAKNNMIAATSNQKFAAELLTYMLVGADEAKRTELRDKLWNDYRRSEEGNVMTFDGKRTVDIDEFDLPVPIK